MNISDIKLIAFYLPQFYPTPYNNDWWGKGFTEWTFVSKCKPVFDGHVQPRLPSDLGFYDLRVIDTRLEQIELAKKYGIYGFCYYYYWFDGQRLLDKPVDAILEHPELDMPFCLCWANENWSRRWDGSEKSILMQQVYNDKNDTKFINDLLPFLQDERYIKINGEPLLLVYRINDLPNPVKTIEKWREVAKENGIDNLHIAAIESFGITDARSFGCDSSVEFPPHGVKCDPINSEIPELSEVFNGKIYNYEDVVSSAISKADANYKLFRGIMPSWDNTPRRQFDSHIFANSSPLLYETWLRHLIHYTTRVHEPQERFIFINAWNEWAEGAVLEPDQYYGIEYLNSTKNALYEKKIDKILDALSFTSKTNGLVSPSLVKDIAIEIKQLQLSLNYFKLLTNRNEILFRTQLNSTPVFNSYPNFLPVSKFSNIKESGYFILDQVNHILVGSREKVYLSLNLSLFVRGWSFNPDIQKGSSSPTLIALVNIENNKVYYSIDHFSNRMRRDVSTHFSDLSESCTLWSGFEMNLDITSQEPGKYKLGIINFSADQAYIAYSPLVIEMY